MISQYAKFIFESYIFDEQKRQILLNYSFDDKLHFTETINLEEGTPLKNARSADVQRAIFALHLAGGISYYKAFAPRQIEVRSGQLSTEQAIFWNNFYTKGLGEYFYKNKIDFRGLINFSSARTDLPKLGESPKNQPQNALVPFGGGKDSQVTVEILRRHQIKMTLFRMQPHPFITQLAELNDLPLTSVKRTLDAKLFDLNAQGAFNGHVPITGYVTFLAIILALLNGQDSVFFSNERSSDYGNVDYLGMSVNHQWSKSMEAERMLANYINLFITKKVQYHNVLRPLSELAIAQLFCRQPKYFMHITSCNRNWLWNNQDQSQHSGRWCGKCEKCAFVFALFAAFLTLPKVIEIFGKNLFNDDSLLPFYRQLWGAESFKPFECVGTPEEMQAALYLAIKRNKETAQTVIGKEFVSQMLPNIFNPCKLVKNVLTPNLSGVSPFVTSIIKQENIHEDF